MKRIFNNLFQYIKRVLFSKPQSDNIVTEFQIDVMPESDVPSKSTGQSLRDLFALCMEPFI